MATPSGRQSVEGLVAMADVDVAQQVVVGDRRRHYVVARSGSSWPATNATWSSAERVRHAARLARRGKEDNDVNEIDHTSAMIEAPPLADTAAKDIWPLEETRKSEAARMAPLRSRRPGRGGRGPGRL